MIRKMSGNGLHQVLLLLAVSALSLGSSVTFCETGDIYNRSYDLSHDYSSRWHNSSEQLTPHWTPDGTHIVFGYAGKIYVVDANGSDLRSLSGGFEQLGLYSQTAEIDFSPSVSPDGERVAYTTLRYAEGELFEHTYEIAAQAIDGSDRRRLTQNNWNDVSPAWAPNGSRIAFISHRENSPRVFTIAPDGTDERNVAPSIRTQTDPPLWSPDGSRLAFVGEDLEENVSVEWVDTYDYQNPVDRTSSITIYREAIYTAHADGSNLTKLAWSAKPDAITRNREEGRVAAPEEDVSIFQWSPDGEEIAFVAHYYGEPPGLYVAKYDGTGIRQIFDFSAIAESQQYIESSVSGIVWSPDGVRISLEFGGSLIINDTWKSDVNVYEVDVNSSELRLLVADIDYMEDYLKWPGALARPWPAPWREFSEGHSEWPDTLGESVPARIVRYIDSMEANVWPEVKGWILSSIAWNGSDEQVLVRLANGRLFAAKPQPADASEAADLCTNGQVVPNPGRNRGLVQDCRMLLAIRDILAGDEVLYWTADNPITQWPGVTVAGSPPRVLELKSVPGVLLSGTIPLNIGDLSELRVLNLSNNAFSKSIPAELGHLKKLEVLDLHNAFAPDNPTGIIPTELGNLKNLRYLDLRNNALTGSIPAELGWLPKLEELLLGFNRFTGTVPPEFGNLKQLRVLDIFGGQEQISGTIPPELGNLSNLEHLVITTNKMTGGIPPELGNLSNLYELRLEGSPGGGGLTGSIPGELGKLNLGSLRLANNELSGEIPPELGSILEGPYGMRLRVLDLNGNLLTGCIPARLEHGFWNVQSDLPFCE